MNRHEASCGEFVKLMKKYGPKGYFANNYKCENDSLPIADVTYYDAVLFANARSRDFAESLAKDSALSTIEIDTVYDYTQSSMDEEGHCSNLAGFMFHPERNGFRLPTEAEWVKAATTEWGTDSSSSEESESSEDEDSGMLISDSGEDTKFEFDPDSAGMYFNESGASPNAAAYRYKMEFLWQYKDFANVVILGSSRASRGVNPLLFSEPIFAINLAIDATSILGHTVFFNNYVLPHVKNLKVLVISIDIDRGKNIGSNTNNIFLRRI